MFFEGKVTTDRNIIIKWVETRKGWPAVARKVRDTGVIDVLEIGFPESEEDHSLQVIDWDMFFQKFDQEQLAFLYKEWTTTGSLSHDFKFI